MGGDGGGDGGPAGDIGQGADVSTGNVVGGSGESGSIGSDFGVDPATGQFGGASTGGTGIGIDGGASGSVGGIPGVIANPEPQVSFSRRGSEWGAFASTVLGVSPLPGIVVGGTVESAIQGSGVPGGVDMSGDPTGGNVVGGPDYVPYTAPGGGAIVPGVSVEKDVPSPFTFTDSGSDVVPPRTPEEIDAMNRLATERHLRFAPGRGEESMTRSLDILSERDSLVGARGPEMFKRKPRSALERREGVSVSY